jgi:peptidoglycan hydrolase-like protein with peptidoglycan-binding domain
MKRIAIALLATAALSMPAMAASNTYQQQPSGSQAQQPQATGNQARDQAAQNQPNNQQTISPTNLSRNEVRQVQQALHNKGLQVGRADGRWGSRTSNALKQFQQKQNIQANGQLDQQTLSDLGLNGAQFAQQNESNSRQH